MPLKFYMTLVIKLDCSSFMQSKQMCQNLATLIHGNIWGKYGVFIDLHFFIFSLFNLHAPQEQNVKCSMSKLFLQIVIKFILNIALEEQNKKESLALSPKNPGIPIVVKIEYKPCTPFQNIRYLVIDYRDYYESLVRF